jgi:DNA-binding transcriptional regulator GbsR (MarR family)
MKELSPVAQQFILHWGEMGTRWGINRTVAQIYALLYLAEKPMNAEDISNALRLARSSVSTSLRELLGWGIVHVTHKLGDRRDYFIAMDDVWETFRVILDERKKRETDPTIEVLHRCLQTPEEADRTDAYARKRLNEMLEFFETMTSAYTQVQKVPTNALVHFAKLGEKIQAIFNMASIGKKKKTANKKESASASMSNGM